jgi:hypothetical protein
MVVDNNKKIPKGIRAYLNPSWDLVGTNMEIYHGEEILFITII